MITFRQIECVQAIYDTGSLSKAAQKLFVSQPALSQSLKKLETELGALLFDRATQPLKLTAAGEIFVREGRELLLQREQMTNRLCAHTSTRNETLRLGISPFYSKYYLPILYPYMAQHYPTVQLKITEAISIELEALTLEDQIDLCFVPSEPQNPKLQYETVCVEEILLAAPPHSRLERYAIPSTGLPYIDLKQTAGENYIILKPEQKFCQL
ncbi:MAG: LysR family transcriptional regulator, partial [Clostridia bacterium]